MKKIIVFFLILMNFFILQINAKEIKIAYENKEQPPYYMGNTSKVLSKNPGVVVEMIQMLDEMMSEIEIKLVRYPWVRCKDSLKKNKVDGIFNASYKKGRLKLGWYPTKNKKHAGRVDISRRVTTIAYSLYKLKGTEIGWDGKNFKSINVKVGAVSGYSIVGDLKKKGVTVDEARSSENNLGKLLLQRVKAVALQDVTADSFIKSEPKKYSKVVKVKPPLVTKPYYLMLSHKFVKENPKLAQKIWDNIRKIRKKQFKKLASKYK